MKEQRVVADRIFFTLGLIGLILTLHEKWKTRHGYTALKPAYLNWMVALFGVYLNIWR